METVILTIKRCVNGKFGIWEINKPYVYIWRFIMKLLLVALGILAIALIAEALEALTRLINYVRWGIE